MGNDLGKCRTEPLSLCGLVIGRTIPLVDRRLPQLKASQVTHDSSATLAEETLMTALHPLHISESAFQSQNFEHPWKSRSQTSYKFGTKKRTLPEFGPLHKIFLDSEKADGSNIRWYWTHQTTQPLKTCTKHIGHGIVRAEEWLMPKFGPKNKVL